MATSPYVDVLPWSDMSGRHITSISCECMPAQQVFLDEVEDVMGYSSVVVPRRILHHNYLYV